jgi:hypothetical protein
MDFIIAGFHDYRIDLDAADDWMRPGYRMVLDCLA